MLTVHLAHSPLELQRLRTNRSVSIVCLHRCTTELHHRYWSTTLSALQAGPPTSVRQFLNSRTWSIGLYPLATSRAFSPGLFTCWFQAFSAASDKRVHSKGTMHKVLQIPELYGHICSYIWFDKQTLARLARTCKLLCEPALKLIWQNLDDIAPLIMCMPDDLWERSDDEHGKLQSLVSLPTIYTTNQIFTGLTP